jgi:hypothetical protein
LKSLGEEVARYNRYINTARSVDGFLDRVRQQVQDAVEDPPHVANEVRKKLVSEGLDELESLVEDTGDSWLQGQLRSVIKTLRQLNDPSLKDQLKEKLQERSMDRLGN